MAVLDITHLNETLRNVSARWTAVHPAEEHHLGFVPGPEDHSLEERARISLANHREFMAMSASAAAAPPYPAAIDWRKYPAHPPLPAGNYVTPIKDQKTCGSCVAFGTLAAFESAVRIHAKNRQRPSISRRRTCSTVTPKPSRGAIAAVRTAAGGPTQH